MPVVTIRTFAALILLGCAALPAPAVAQRGQASSFDQLGLLVGPGDKVTVTPSTGKTFSGRIAGLSPDTLTLRVGKQVVTLQQEEVSAIRHRRDDSLVNGAAWGLTVGTVAGFAPCGRCHIGPGLAMAGLYGGIGAGIGVGIDALIRGNATVFRRGQSGSRVVVTPQLAPSHKAVSVSVQF